MDTYDRAEAAEPSGLSLAEPDRLADLKMFADRAG